MKEAGKIRRNIRTTVWCMLLAGIMGIFGNGISAEAADYGLLITSGTCGAEGNVNGVTWAVYDSNEDGDGIANTRDTLVLGGSGAMVDWTQGSLASWSTYQDEIKKVIFEVGSGITNIGECAFYQCSSLTSIDLPEGIISIGRSAFSGCSLTSIDLPEGIISIGGSAFSGCSLTSIDLPDSVTMIDGSAFLGSRLSISVSEENERFSSEDGVLYNKDKSMLIACRKGLSYCIPEGVTSIGKYAFGGSAGTNMEIPKGIISIGEGAFINCKSMKSIDLPDSVTNIGAKAFKGCYALESIDLPDNVTNIGASAFYECRKLTSIKIPDKVTVIEDQTFYQCERIISVEIPDSVTSIGSFAFQTCQFVDIELPEELTSIGMGAFFNCFQLTNIKIPENVTHIGGKAFQKCMGLKSVEIPEGIISIGDYAFSYCNQLTNIKIPEGLTSIGNYAFEWCTSLKSIEFSEGLTDIGYHAFEGCTSLTSIDLPEGLTSIGTNAFIRTKITSIEIPSSVTSMGADVFTECGQLKVIYYPSTVVLHENARRFTISYTLNNDEDDTVSLIVQKLPTDNSITLPADVAGKTISSLEWKSGIDGSGVVINCTKHYSKTKDWEYNKEEHCFKECNVCKAEKIEVGEHSFGDDGTEACECGYVPFVINTQPQDKTWSYASVSDEERKVSVEVTATTGDEEIAYQWYEDDKLVAGATESTYKITEEIKSHNCYCVISSGGYSINSDTITASVVKAQGIIHVETEKKEITLDYSEEPVALEGITKTGEGSLVYTVTEGNEVLSVSGDGKVTFLGVGTAVISIDMAETANYKSADTKNIKVKVMTHYPAVTPDTPVAVENTVKKVSEVSLPDKWEWDSEDAQKTLPAGEDLTVTANYTGDDKEFYYNTSVRVTIQRAGCTGSEILYTGAGEKAPTCTEEGKGHRECIVCGDMLEEDITVPVVRHNLSGVSKDEADCETAGKEAYFSCSVCKKLFSDEEGKNEVTEASLIIQPLGHDLIKVEEEKATDESQGRKSHYSCKRCEKMFSDETGENEVTEDSLVIPTLIHTGGEATCTKKAVCTVCQKEYGELNKKNHKETEVRNAKEADCCEAGYTGDVYCKDCGEKLTAGEEIKPQAHKLDKVEEVKATDETKGKKAHYSCGKCKKMFSDPEGKNELTEDDVVIPALKHAGGEATCTKKAVCTICQKEYGEVDKSNHKETEVRNAKEADCCEAGYTGDVYCKDCGEKVSAGEEIPVSGHNLAKVEEEKPTGETQGFKLHYSCDKCKKMFSDPEGKNEVTADDLVIPVLTHTGGEATCTKKAVCTTCQKEYGELNKKNHKATEVRNAKEADCCEAGYTGDIYCKDCGEQVSAGEEIPTLAHDLTRVEKKEATSETPGEEEHYSCNHCKKTFADAEGKNEIKAEDLVIPVLKHTGGEATCTKKAVCTTCQKEYGELNKNNHKETEVRNAKEAGCSEAGYTGDTYCKDCGEKVAEGEEVKASGHDLTRVEKKEATSDKAGVKEHYNCKCCNKKFSDPEGKNEVTADSLVIPAGSGIPTGKPEVPEEGTVIVDTQTKRKYKILVADAKNGTVEYVTTLHKNSKTAYVPNTVTLNGITYRVVSIGKNAFKNHKSITRITIGKNVVNIGAGAFSGCKKLKNVFMGKNIISIGDKAFYKCTALKKIGIPAKVRKVGKKCFYGCKKLEKITIKSTKLTKKNVGSKAFTGVNKKATVKVPKKQLKSYQKLLKSKGLSKTVKVKK